MTANPNSVEHIMGVFGPVRFLPEKYNPRKNAVPARFTGKQFGTNPPALGNLPQHVCFDKNFKGLYEKKKYMDQVPYISMQKERKNGFGTSDATKRDEFCFQTRGEQYREQMLQEMKLIGSAENPLQKLLVLDTNPENKGKPRDRYGHVVDMTGEFQGPENLHDVGKSVTTNYCRKCPRERWYCPHRVADKAERVEKEGAKVVRERVSQEIGRGGKIDAKTYESSAHARRPLIKGTFYRKTGVLNNDPN